jgi:hypothetical protein
MDVPPFDPHPERPSSGNGCDARRAVPFVQQAEKAETRKNRHPRAQSLCVRARIRQQPCSLAVM